MKTSRRNDWIFLWVVLALGGGRTAAFAQSLTGQLSGRVVDESGAVLPGADVSLENDASGDARRTVSNHDGHFVFAAVPAGTYKLTVSLSGFQKSETTAVILRLGDKRTLGDVGLNVAGLQESVTVAAAVDRAPLDSGEKSATITGEQIQSLSIVGRSAAELLKILPGMTPTIGQDNRGGFSGEVMGINGNGEGGRQSALGNYSANGTRTDAIDITIDGAPAADPGCNCATPVNPNPEMVAEFKVLQSNFGAEHAKGPVTMNVVSKSGGREFHGSVYSHLRDFHLNANDWLLNKIGQPRTENKFFFPGATLGGPLRIPGTSFNKNKDKLFFFVGFESYRQRLDTGLLRSYVPTAAMRQGDFRELPSLGLGGSAVNQLPNVPGGVIPANQIDPGGRVLLNLLPMPNVDPRTAGGYNFAQSIPVDQNGYQALTRLDVNVSDNTKLFLRYARQRETQPFPVGLWWRNPDQVPYPTKVVADNVSDSGTASLTHVFNPSLTNETILGVTYINFPNRFEDPGAINRSNLGYPYQGIFKENGGQIPSFTSNITQGGGPTLFNPGGFDPVLFAKKVQLSVADNVTKVAGRHTVKVGGYYEWVINNQPGNEDSAGLITNHPSIAGSSGNAFADLLMGRVGNYQESTQNVLRNEAHHRFEIYAQDSWKIRPRLTLEYGLRVSHLGAWYDREGNGMVVFDPARYNPNASLQDLSGLVWNGRDSSIPLSGVDVKPVFFAPRVGFAWDIKGTGDTVLRGGFGIFRYQDPQNPAATTIQAGTSFRKTVLTTPTTLAALETFQPTTAKPDVSAWQLGDDQQPETRSWSVTVHRRLPWSLAIEASYVGNSSRHLPNSGGPNSGGGPGLSNVNFVPLGAMLANPEGNPDDFRPFQLYGNMQVYNHSFYQNYHGLQTLLSRPAGRFTFTLAYTFSKNLGIRGGGVGDTGVSLVNSPELGMRNTNYGVLATDRTHVGSFAYSLALPDVGTGAVKAVLGNWQISGISTLLSGAPIQAFTPNFNLTGTLADGRAINATRINGTPDIPAQPVLMCDPREGVGEGQLFNAGCFAPPTPGNNGTFVFPYVRGASFSNHDLSLFKNVPLRGAMRIQLRLSAYNVFNRPQSFPDASNNLTMRVDNGVVRADPRFGQLPDDNKFGRRIVQLGVRFTF